MMRNTISILHYQSDQQKKDVMEHVVCKGKPINSALWLGNHKERQILGDLGTDGCTALQRILRNTL
jgi:hypothetical protein